MINHFTSWHNFFQMGGYAMYVWPSYILVFSVLLFALTKVSLQLRYLIKKLRYQNANKA